VGVNAEEPVTLIETDEVVVGSAVVERDAVFVLLIPAFVGVLLGVELRLGVPVPDGVSSGVSNGVPEMDGVTAQSNI
jgi:hypothetical protein